MPHLGVSDPFFFWNPLQTFFYANIGIKNVFKWDCFRLILVFQVYKQYDPASGKG